MAEIKIEKKKKPVWPWILLLLAIAALVILIWPDSEDTDEVETNETEMVDTEREETMQNAEGGDEQNLMTSVDEYSRFLGEKGDSMGLEHKYTHQGITLMAEALKAMAQEMPAEIEVQQEVQKLKEQADKIKEDTYAGTHANTIRDAFISASKVIQMIQEKRFPDMASEAQALRSEAEQIQKDVLTLEQKDNVNSFFKDSAQMIENMAKKINSQS